MYLSLEANSYVNPTHLTSFTVNKKVNSPSNLPLVQFFFYIPFIPFPFFSPQIKTYCNVAVYL